MSISELVYYIDQHGIGLDYDENEVKDEDGNAVVVPESERGSYAIIERSIYWN